MTRTRILGLVIGLLCCLLLASAVLADSTYGLDEFAVVGGGGAAQAGSYGLQRMVIGQAVVGDSSSSGYDVCIGSACAPGYRVYLPVVLRNYS